MKIGPVEVVAYFAGGAVVCIAVLATTHLIAGDTSAREWLGQNAPAWVQAVGSVAAIVFGFWYSERRLKLEDVQKIAKSRRALLTIGLELLDYLTRTSNHLRKNPGYTEIVDEATLDGWQIDIRTIDVWLLDRIDRSRYATLRSQLRTMGHRMRPPVSEAMSVDDMSLMSKLIWDHVVKPLNEAGVWDE